MEIRKNNIKQTIIKGYRKTRQLVDVTIGRHSIPEKEYEEVFYESEKALKTFDGELFCKKQSADPISWSFYDPLNGAKVDEYSVHTKECFIYVNQQKVKILNTRTKDDILYLIVDIHVDTEDKEQEFEKETILEKYNKKIDKYWEGFINKYKDDKHIIALIEVYQNQGMEREDIIPLILGHANNTKSEKNITVPIIVTQNYEQKNPKNSPIYSYIGTSIGEALSSLADRTTRITWQ